jgi:hypothetical protein
MIIFVLIDTSMLVLIVLSSFLKRHGLEVKILVQTIRLWLSQEGGLLRWNFIDILKFQISNSQISNKCQ